MRLRSFCHLSLSFIGMLLAEQPLLAQARPLLAQARPMFAQARQDPYVRYPAPQREQNTLKNLVGQVVSGQGKELAQAVVHLKNKKTLEVKTRISDAEGKYVFRGLDREADYEVHAEYQGAASDKKNVSSFDDRDEIYLVLEIPTK